ncbi:hypothetical protein N431DRAFT_454528 [Stipitochalara longipes BDJ]|nr:hypothetical protein N431DRAFT_454528 [Stipitochalara longipes BDJ]
MKTQSGLSVWAPKPTKATSNNDEIMSKDETSGKTATKVAVADPQLRTTKLAADEAEQPVGEFVLFPKLPPELRNKIWELSIPGPRIVTITHDPKDMAIVEIEKVEAWQSPFWRAKANAGPVPTLLHVNKEARSFMNHKYNLFFDVQTQGRPIYFDVARDTLCFPSREAIRTFLGNFMKGDRKRAEEDVKHMHDVEHTIRFLALGQPLLYFGSLVRKILARYPNLEHVTIVKIMFWNRGAQISQLIIHDCEKSWRAAGSKVPTFEQISYRDYKTRFLQR